MIIKKLFKSLLDALGLNSLLKNAYRGWPNDVTAGYIIVDVERLRKPMQLITDYILKCMEMIESAEVIN